MPGSENSAAAMADQEVEVWQLKILAYSKQPNFHFLAEKLIGRISTAWYEL